MTVESQRPTSVALLNLYARSDVFIGDAALQGLCAQIESQGHTLVLVRSVASEHAGSVADWMAPIAAHVKREDCDVVVLVRAWDRAIIEVLRATLDARVKLVRLTGGVAAALDDRFDHVIDDKSLLSLLGGDSSPRPSVYRPTSAREIRANLTVLPAHGQPQVRAVDPSGRAAPERPMITGPATGCPFLLDARSNPVYADLAMDPATLQTRGCTFCLDNTGAFAMPSEADVIASWMSQLRSIRSTRPDAREVLLTDERPHPFLPAFFQAVADAPDVGPVELMIKSRVDWLLEFADGPVARALEIGARSGSVLHMYLVGFENFDQFHLDLFNKGVTVADNVRAIAKLRELGERFPTSFEYRRYRAHGVVLFTPWTTPEALLENARWMRALNFGELRSEAVRTRLRLYPRVPLHALAERDGLLADAFENQRGDRAREQGYDASVPWRFRDARTEAIFHASDGLRAYDRSLSDADVLEIATRFVLRWPGLAAAPSLAHLPLRHAVQGWGVSPPMLVSWLGAAGASFDLEIDGIASGRKRAALKETVPREDAEGLVAGYRAMGLCAAVVSLHDLAHQSGAHAEGQSLAIVAVARDESALEEVLAMQRSLEARRGEAGVRAVGALMGYPSCCIEAFIALPDRGDNLANEREPFRSAPAVPLDARLNRLARVKVVSHHLCSPACAASIAIAEETLAQLGSFAPDAADWIRADLARPVLFIDYAHRASLAGKWDGNGFRVDGIESIGSWSFAAPLDGVSRMTVAPDGVELHYATGRRATIGARSPLLLVPGEPLNRAALDAAGGPIDRTAPSLPRSAAAIGLPPAFRAGATVRQHRIASIRATGDGYQIVLGRGDELVKLEVRSFDPARHSTLRRGRWAIDVEAPEGLTAQAREALTVLVGALPR